MYFGKELSSVVFVESSMVGNPLFIASSCSPRHVLDEYLFFNRFVFTKADAKYEFVSIIIIIIVIIIYVEALKKQ